MIKLPDSIYHKVQSGIVFNSSLVVTSLHDEELFLRFAGTCGCTSFSDPNVYLPPKSSKEVFYSINRSSNYTGKIQVYKRNNQGVYEYLKDIPLNVEIS